MRIIATNVDIHQSQIDAAPWIHFRRELARRGITIDIRPVDRAFESACDAMLVYAWLDWDNPVFFRASSIMPLLSRYAEYRARCPDTVQILCNSTDMSRRPYVLPYWRPGDPVLYRTPAYDRAELAPLPAADIWAYELVWGSPVFRSREAPRFKAGFVGTPSGPDGYRIEVARQTARVGFGICEPSPMPLKQYHAKLASCEIVVCPRGWGEQSLRHWDAWKSGKPVLTDRDCDAVEMIPGLRLEAGVHYLVYDAPAEIPDIVSDWTRPSRRDALMEIAENGRRAALSYDPLARMEAFFKRVLTDRGRMPPSVG